MSDTLPMSQQRRIEGYYRQNGGQFLTEKQQRRLRLAERGPQMPAAPVARQWRSQDTTATQSSITDDLSALDELDTDRITVMLRTPGTYQYLVMPSGVSVDAMRARLRRIAKRIDAVFSTKVSTALGAQVMQIVVPE